jgi:tRNA(fMet)-specific endonuclease VapC
MVHKSERKADNLPLVENLLEDMCVYPVDNEVADIYGQIKAAVLDRFGPRERARRRRTMVEGLGFKENDLWIAATAKHHEFTVVSADKDFERMQQAFEFPLERWWTPKPDR